MPFNPLIEADKPTVERQPHDGWRKWDVTTALAAVVGIALIVLMIVTS